MHVVLLYNTVKWAWWDWELSGWLTTLLQCFNTGGWVNRPVKHRPRNDLNCVEWDAKSCSTQLNPTFGAGPFGNDYSNHDLAVCLAVLPLLDPDHHSVQQCTSTWKLVGLHADESQWHPFSVPDHLAELRTWHTGAIMSFFSVVGTRTLLSWFLGGTGVDSFVKRSHKYGQWTSYKNTSLI